MQQGRSQSAAAPPSEGSMDCKQWFGTVFTNDKAGMAAVDKEKVKKVVYEMSKDSAHFRNDLRKQTQTENRIRKMKEKASMISATEIAGHTRAMDIKMAALKASADLTRTWLHIDMDAFFASVEELDDPSLKTKPMAVGGIGMISTANYVARKFGIRSAMPGFIGRRLCPQLVFVKPDFSKYVRVAAQTRAIFVDYDPDFEAGSLDEGYLDVTDYCHMHSSTGEAVAGAIRKRVRDEVRVTCSCGIGPNRLLAKVASDMRKPDGQYAISADNTAILRFVETLPIRKVQGIGKVTEQVLKAFDIETCAGLIANRGLLSALFLPKTTNFLMAAGLGIGRTQHGEPVEEGAIGRKGISNERTFQAISATAELEAKCAELSEKLAEDMASEGLKGKTLTLKLKETNFEVRTRNATLTHHIHSKEDIFREALKLLRAELPITIRLMGIRMSSFLETNTGPGQKTLSAFLKKDGDDSVAGPAPPQQHGWNQTFLCRETREELAKQMQEHRLRQEAETQSGNPASTSGGTTTATAAQDACQSPHGAGEASSMQQKQGREAPETLEGHVALEPSQATEAASQPLELTLRDWQPSTASQLIRPQATPSQNPQHAEHMHHSSQSVPLGEHRQSSLAGESRGQPEQSPGGAVPSQDPQHAQHTHHSSQGSLRYAPHEHRHSILQRDIREQPEQVHDNDELADNYGEGLSACRDVLDIADEAGEPDLAHAWEEEPAGIGEVDEEAHQSGSQSAATKGASALRTWACQVCTFDDNRHQILRCAVCDAVRGTSLGYFMGHHAEVSSGTQHDAQDSAAKSGSRSRRAGSEGTGNKQKSIIGFFAGFETPAKTSDANAQASIGRSNAAASERPDSGSQPDQAAQHASEGGPWQEVEGGTWLCKQCAQRVSEREKSEHEDFHIALEMSRDPSGPVIGKPMQGSTGSTQTQRKRKFGSGVKQSGVSKRGVKSVAAFLKPPGA